MSIRELKINDVSNEWLELVRKRDIKIPIGYLKINYQSDVDLLFIRFNDGESTYSTDDQDKGVIFNYDSCDRLVSIEVLNLYDIFVTI